MAEQMTPEARARWESIQQNPNVNTVLYGVKDDGGFTFAVKPAGDPPAHWRDFAVNPDGGKAYPLS